MAHPFDEWPWGYCAECKMLIVVGDEELMVRHDRGFTQSSYNPSVRIECPGSLHSPAEETPDTAFEEQPIKPHIYFGNEVQ